MTLESPTKLSLIFIAEQILIQNQTQIEIHLNYKLHTHTHTHKDITTRYKTHRCANFVQYTDQTKKTDKTKSTISPIDELDYRKRQSSVVKRN